MENGFLRLPRVLFKSAAWSTPRVFSTFEAYLDLLQLGYYRSYQYFHQGKYIDLEPGDLLTTSSKLARRWGWEKEDVRTWLKHLMNHRVLTAKVVDGLLKISLDPYCHSHFTQIPENLLPPAPGGKEGGLLSSASSEKEEEKNSSVLSSSENREKTEEGKTEEVILRVSEAKKTEEEKSDTRAGGRVESLVLSILSPDPAPQTTFPPDFPMEEFRRYVDAALRNLDPKLRPRLHQGWMAQMRDKFLAEKEKAATSSSQPIPAIAS